MIVILGRKNEKERAGSDAPALQKYVYLYWGSMEHCHQKRAVGELAYKSQSCQVNLNC